MQVEELKPETISFGNMQNNNNIPLFVSFWLYLNQKKIIVEDFKNPFVIVHKKHSLSVSRITKNRAVCETANCPFTTHIKPILGNKK